MKKSKLAFSLFSILLVLSIVSCASTQVTRTGADEVIDLSGRWNDTDSRLVAEEMIRDVMSRPWLPDFVNENAIKPVVIVGAIRNKSSEHIETAGIVKNIERELINSGKVKFVASKEERMEVRDERVDQQSNASEDTTKRLAAETGADFMLKGVITSVTDAIEGKKVVLYQVDLEFIHLENNEKVWLGSKSIKKFIKQSKNKW